jgi:hypothetical protein
MMELGKDIAENIKGWCQYGNILLIVQYFGVCLRSKYEVQMIRFYNIKMKDNFEGDYQDD